MRATFIIRALATHGLVPRELEGSAAPAPVLTPLEEAIPEDDGLLTDYI
jgi:hypothetical protein